MDSKNMMFVVSTSGNVLSVRHQRTGCTLATYYEYVRDVFSTLFPYLPLRCALGVPSVGKGNEGEPKVNLRCT